MLHYCSRAINISLSRKTSHYWYPYKSIQVLHKDEHKENKTAFVAQSIINLTVAEKITKTKLEAGDEKFQKSKLDKANPKALQTQYKAYSQLLAIALPGYVVTDFSKDLTPWIAST